MKDDPHGKDRRRFGRRPWGSQRPSRPVGPVHARKAATARTDWDHVASWYDRLVGDEGSDYHRHLILPAALRLLELTGREKLLDLCCGQGVFCRLAAPHASAIVGVDASSQLIQAARKYGGGENISYVVADARDLGPLADGSFDAAACLMALQDLDDLDAALAGLAGALKAGGRVVIVMMHPCFRVPRQSSWGWDNEKKSQFRRLDRYGSPLEIPIYTHPGSGGGQQTVFYHRPLDQLLSALGRAGLAVVAAEELYSHHVSQPGAHSRGENRARTEFPIFLALKLRKI